MLDSIFTLSGVKVQKKKKKRLLNHTVEYHAASYEFAAVAFKNEIGKRLLSLVK